MFFPESHVRIWLCTAPTDMRKSYHGLSALVKFKKLKRHRHRAEHWLGRVAKKFPSLFPHWRVGLLPTVG
jgi:hypothetical protein